MTIAIDPTNPPAGGTVTVSIKGSSRAGETVNVLVLGPKGQTQNVPINLDANGDGSAQWTAPADWEEATFRYGSCPEEFIVIGALQAGE